MGLDGSLLGLSPNGLALAGAVLAIGIGLVLAVLALRAEGQRRLVLAAGAVAAFTCIPASDTGLVTFALAGTSIAFVLASRGFTRVGAWRALRLARVSLLRMPRAQLHALVFVAVVGLALALSWALFDGVTVIQDSQAQLFHARILATGHATLPSPPCADHFLADHVIVRPALYSQYPPGHIVVLAVGVLAHAPMLVNPVLGGLGVLAVGSVARALHGEQTARRAMLLGLGSPFVLLMSSEAMSHATGLLLFALALRALVGFRKTGSISSALALGVLFGAQLLTRPVTALALALPVGACLLRDALRDATRRRGMFVLSFAGVAVGSLLLAWNQATNGSPWTMGYVVRWGPLHTFGFHPTPWGDPHTPWLGLRHTFSNLVAWNAYLFGGPIPAVFLVVLGVARDRRWALTWVLALAPIAILVVHFFYFFQDLIFGPRYLYEASAGLLVLAARGLGGLPGARAVRGAVAIAVVLAATTFWPYALWAYHRGYCPRGGLVARTTDALQAAGAGPRAIVFVDEPYERAFFTVDPSLERDPVLFVRDLGDERNAACLDELPDREPWLVRRGSLRRLSHD
jgi:hypothetical protein